MEKLEFRQGVEVEIIPLESLEGVNIEIYNRIRAGKRFTLDEFKLVDGVAHWKLPGGLSVLSFKNGEPTRHSFMPEHMFKRALL